MVLTNVDNFFMILEKFIKMDRDNGTIGISIVIFRNGEKTYNIYFGLNQDTKTVVHEDTLKDEKNFLQKNHTYLIREKTGVCLENVSETELNYILFAFNKKYGVKNETFINIPTVINFCSNGVLFPSIAIHFHKDNVKRNLLLYHLNGTTNNSWMYSDWLTNKNTQQKLIGNYKRSYNDYVRMLRYYLSNFYINPFEAAYISSYDEFVDEIGEQAIEDDMQQNKLDKQFIFVPADSFIEETY